jgi:hypothetical protein
MRPEANTFRSSFFLATLTTVILLGTLPSAQGESSLQLQIAAAFNPEGESGVYGARVASTSQIYNTETSIECKSILDTNCTGLTQDRGTTYARLAAPSCTNESQVDCVSKLYLVDKGNETTLGAYPIPDSIVTEGTKIPYTPAGGLPGLFRLPSKEFGSDRFIAALVTNEFTVSSTALRFQSFQANLFPVRIIAGDFLPFRPVFGPFGGTPNPQSQSGSDTSKCLWTFTGGCVVSDGQLPDVELGFEYVSGRPMGGWWLGRINDANLKTISAGNGTTTFKVSAFPAVVQQVNRTKVTLNSKEFGDLSSNPEFESGLGISQGVQLADLDIGLSGQINKNSSTGRAFTLPYSLLEAARRGLADKSSLETKVWAINSMFDDGLDVCARDNVLQGVVTTNSLLFSAFPPVFREGGLEYEVAGLHLDSKGELFAGKYTLILNNDYARCLYRINRLPTTAVVQITSDDGTMRIATVTVNSDEIWSTLRATNFTFSRKTLKVNLTPASTLPTKVATKKVTITCIKGKLTKKVTAVNPKCPVGYKKK